MLLFLPKIWAKDRFVSLHGDHFSTILGLSREPHRMIRLDKEGAPDEFVNDDLEKLEVNLGPCIFVGLQPSPGSSPTYKVFTECFDLAAETESKSFLYETDSDGNIVRYGSLTPFAEYRSGDPLFDTAAWTWVTKHVTSKLQKRIAARRALGVDPLNPYKVNPKGEHPGPRVTPPVLIHSADAEFSDVGRRANISGISLVTLVVDTRGMPVNIRTARPLGYGMDEQAVKAVEQYRFQPSLLEGKPVAVQINVEVNFHLCRSTPCG
jgi:TonB family protein